MAKIELTLDDKDIIQAVRDYIFKLGYQVKSSITLDSNVKVSVSVEKHYPTYGSSGKD